MPSIAGAPSQQWALRPQCGQRHLVAIGSNVSPQLSHSMKEYRHLRRESNPESGLRTPLWLPAYGGLVSTRGFEPPTTTPSTLRLYQLGYMDMWSLNRESNPADLRYEGRSRPAPEASVPMRGVEPPRPKSPVSKTGVATSYTTSALSGLGRIRTDNRLLARELLYRWSYKPREAGRGSRTLLLSAYETDV